MNKLEKIENRKKKIGSRNDRRLKKYSKNFEQMFTFFLQSYRKDILTFCGSAVDVHFDINTHEGMFTFREFDNGRFKNKELVSKHPNILKAVITGKKSWGLFKDSWSDGIVDWTFTKEEIFKQFEDNGIEVPNSLEKEFDNIVEKKKRKRNEEYLNKLKKQNTHI